MAYPNELMKLTVAALVAASGVVVRPAVAAEVYRCSVDGRTVFQDHACGATGSKLELPKSPAAGATSPTGGAGAPTGAAAVGQSAWMKQRERDNVQEQIDLEERRKRDTRTEMEGKLDELRAKKGSALNNLAGATWEGSISTEMQAVTMAYEGRIRDIDAKIADLRAQRDAIR